MTFVNVPSTESADYINAQKGEFEDTYYVDNLNTLGAGGSGGSASAAFFVGPNVSNSMTITSGSTGPIRSTSAPWQQDYNNITNLDASSLTAQSYAAFINNSGSILNLYLEVGVFVSGGGISFQFVPQTSANGSSWTDAFTPGSTRLNYLSPGNASMVVVSKVTVPNTHLVRLAAYQNTGYSLTFSVYTCKITQV